MYKLSGILDVKSLESIVNIIRRDVKDLKNNKGALYTHDEMEEAKEIFKYMLNTLKDGK